MGINGSELREMFMARLQGESWRSIALRKKRDRKNVQDKVIEYGERLVDMEEAMNKLMGTR